MNHVHLAALLFPLTLALSLPVDSPPGQPTHIGDVGTFKMIPDSIVSSQQVSANYTCFYG